MFDGTCRRPAVHTQQFGPGPGPAAAQDQLLPVSATVPDIGQVVRGPSCRFRHRSSCCRRDCSSNMSGRASQQPLNCQMTAQALRILAEEAGSSSYHRAREMLQTSSWRCHVTFHLENRLQLNFEVKMRNDTLKKLKSRGDRQAIEYGTTERRN